MLEKGNNISMPPLPQLHLVARLQKCFQSTVLPAVYGPKWSPPAVACGPVPGHQLGPPREEDSSFPPRLGLLSLRTFSREVCPPPHLQKQCRAAPKGGHWETERPSQPISQGALGSWDDSSLHHHELQLYKEPPERPGKELSS